MQEPDREHMRDIGRKGGRARGKKARDRKQSFRDGNVDARLKTARSMQGETHEESDRNQKGDML